MPKYYLGNEFEALKSRFQDQTNLLHRMTLIDLQIFTGYIAMQLAFGSWLATNLSELANMWPRIGLFVIDLTLTSIAFALLCNNAKRRAEVVNTVENCNEALGYEQKGIYLEDRSLNAHTKYRSWAPWLYAGVIVGLIGVSIILFAPDLAVSEPQALGF